MPVLARSGCAAAANVQRAWQQLAACKWLLADGVRQVVAVAAALTLGGGLGVVLRRVSFLQLLRREQLPEAHCLHGVGVAGHDGQALLIVAVGAQQREHLIAFVCQDDVALQAAVRGGG
jgi:hypothetical protein